MPTDRLKFPYGPETLRAYSVASRNSTEPVDGQTLGRFLKIAPVTAILNNKFLNDVGLIERRGKGKYVPAEAVNEWRRKVSFEDPHAAAELAPLFETTWFYKTLVLRDEMGPVSRADAVRVLADQADADESYTTQIEMLLMWLEFVGLLDWSDDLMCLNTSDQLAQWRTVAPPGANPASTETTPSVPEVPVATTAPPVQQDRTSPTALAFSFDIHITMDDLAKLTSEQISALFGAAGTLAAIAKAGKD